MSQGNHHPALEVRDLCKSFGGVRALRSVSLSVRPGEVHGLLGENGSGKSTLIKALAGFHVPDSGGFSVSGRPVELPMASGAFRTLGIDFVHQDLGLIPALTVVENLRIGDLAAARRRAYIDWREERRRARQTFERYGVDLDPSARVEELQPVQRALLAIVRAVEAVQATVARGPEGLGGGLLVLDEPTVFLPRTGTDQLFSLVREIVARGASVLFVSHDLEEVLEVTDRVTVLRDGRVVGTVRTAETTEGALVDMIIGRRLAAIERPTAKPSDGPVVAAARAIDGALLTDFSLNVRRGEVVGLAGLVGSGFEEAPYLLFGAWPALSGTLTTEDGEHDLRRMTPRRAIDLGMALVPADRQRDASLPTLPIVDNVTLHSLNGFFKGFVLRRREMIRSTAKLMQVFDVRPPNPRPVYSSLSGGNQQKALLAKWLQTEPRLLLLHEPTQGVDVGAREQIFSLIRDAVARGMSVVCASSDYEQLAMICDRVIVIGRGRITAELSGEDVIKHRITECCYNSMTLSDTKAVAV